MMSGQAISTKGRGRQSGSSIDGPVRIEIGVDATLSYHGHPRVDIELTVWHTNGAAHFSVQRDAIDALINDLVTAQRAADEMLAEYQRGATEKVAGQ